MTTIFGALHQTEEFVNEITIEFSLRQRKLFNMFLLSQIVNSEAMRAEAMRQES